MRTRSNLILLLAIATAELSWPQVPEDRAIAYLAEEVRLWPENNHCFSCHNNGDGARALGIAAKMGKQVAPTALRETLLWLANPAGWEKGGENPAVNDKVLAAIQFAAALNELQEPDTAATRKAAEIVAGSQKPDGSWVIDEGSIGSPATYGTALGTYMALRALERGNTGAFTERIRKARDWLQHRNASSVLDASAPMLAGVADHRKLIIAWQNKDGGWGPWAKSPSEPFDTAMAMLALQAVSDRSGALLGGRGFLTKSQQSAGGWHETTRPSGSESYAQHISTTAWATIALLRTDPKRQ